MAKKPASADAPTSYQIIMKKTRSTERGMMFLNGKKYVVSKKVLDQLGADAEVISEN